MKRNMFEAILGAVVLAAAAFFMFFAYSAADIGATDGYRLSATFNKIGGLTTGNDVRISGVKIGTVKNISLDQSTYQARAELAIANNVKLPVDTVAQVATEGLLGGYFLQLNPGVEEDYIENGGEIEFTQAPVDLMDLLGRFIFSADKKKDE